MALIKTRERARALRKQGLSIAAIAKNLSSNKSSVSYWCRDIVLSLAQIQQLAEKQKVGGAIGRLRAGEKKRADRIDATRIASEQGAKEIGSFSRRDLFICGLGLYWGEGYKRGNDELGFTNSDLDIVKTYIAWLKKIYHVRLSDLIVRVSVNNSHRNRITVIEQYWSKETGIPLSQFTKTSLIKTRSRKIYADPGNHFGTLRIKVRRGTALRRRIIGSIHEIARQSSR